MEHQHSAAQESRRKPSYCLALTQLSGNLRRMGVEKRRAVRTTCCEFFSHFIIISLLIFGYNLSQVETYDAKKYTAINVRIPFAGVEFDNVSVSTSAETGESAYSQITDIIQGPLVVPNLDTYFVIGQAIASAAGGLERYLSLTVYGESLKNMIKPGTLHLAPAGELVDSFVAYMNSTFFSFRRLDVMIHDSEASAVDFILSRDHGRAPLALIVLRRIDQKKVNYVIRQHYARLPNTNNVIEIPPPIGLDLRYLMYFFSGYLTLQQAVDDWVFEYTNVTKQTDPVCANGPPRAVYVPYPTEAYDQNPFYPSVGFLLGLGLIMSMMYPMSKLTKSIVEEKETRMRELMKILGMKDWVHQFSWFISAFVVFFWISISASYLCSNSFLPNSSPFLVFLFFFLFCLSLITLSFLISVFFSNAKLAAIAAPVVLFVTILPRYIFYSTTVSEQVSNKLLACLLSPAAFAFGADIIGNFEYTGEGIQSYNIDDGDFNFSYCLLMLWWDFLLYGLLAWYLDQVLPQMHGTPRSPWFLFSVSYWCGCFMFENADGDRYLMQFQDLPDLIDDEEGGKEAHVEPIPSALRPLARVRIKNLRKQYDDGKVAVKQLSLSMVEGQITCLLGHNGAGKSTTIAALTGMTEATAGDVDIYGHLLSRDLLAIRRSTGLCPQHNVLFPTLTVWEHLLFFGRIKGLSGRGLYDAAYELMDDVGLTEKRNTKSTALSGGMKRKLCLAIAFLGDPQFVLLDEPTSGMDPYSRRATWDLLERKKANRVILLTTHFLDEADTLADRIAILSEGQLRCVGSSLFLKNRFGAGYLLSLSMQDSEQHVRQLEQAVQALIPEAKIKSAVAREVIFQLPMAAVGVFSSLFSRLEQQKESLGINAYGVSITTLEQVFISLAHQGQEETPTTSEEITAHLFAGHRTTDDDGNDRSYCGQAVDLYRTLTSWLRMRWFRVMGGFYRFVPQDSRHRAIRPREVVPLMETELVKRAPIPSEGEEKSGDFTKNGYQSISQTNEDNDLSANDNAEEEAKHHGNAAGGEQELERASFASPAPNQDKNEEHSAELNTQHRLACETPTDSEAREVEKRDYDQDSGSIVWIQLFELYRKRVIVASRDLKGFFFQVIFPAIQIFLIMLTLNINLQLAGKTVILNGDIYARYTNDIYPTVVDKYLPASHRHFPLLESIRGRFERYFLQNVTDSTMMSDYLLNKTYSANSRIGSYVFDDVLPVNLTVDWVWLREFVETNEDSLDETLQLINNQFDGLLPRKIYLSDLSIGSLNLTALNLSRDALDRLEDVFNEDILSPLLNTTVDLADDLLPQNGGLVSIDDLLSDESYVIISDGNITFVLLNRENENILNLTAGFDELPGLLLALPWPNTTETYSFNASSSYTILHNTSSAHAAASWGGELVESAFQLCVDNLEKNPVALNRYDHGNYEEDTEKHVMDIYHQYSNTSASERSRALPHRSFHFQPMGKDSDSEDSLYFIKNHPLPISTRQNIIIRVILSVLTSLFILVPLCYIPAAFVSFLVRERVSKSKHLQLVSGVSPYLYWLAAYLYDMTLFAILTGLILMAFYITGRSNATIFVGSVQSNLSVLVLLLLYGAAAMPLNYLYSFMFTNPSTAQIVLTVINFMTGFVTVLAFYVMSSIPQTRDVAMALVHVFRFFPAYNVGEALINLSTAYYQRTILDEDKEEFDWEVTGRSMAYLAGEMVVFLTIVLLTESSYLHGYYRSLLAYLSRSLASEQVAGELDASEGIDADVEEEKRRVELYLERWNLMRHLPDAISMPASQGYQYQQLLGEPHALDAADRRPDVESIGGQQQLELTSIDDHRGEHRNPVTLPSNNRSEGDTENMALLLHDIRKTYYSLGDLFCSAKNIKHAVRGISLACSYGERFGLLGVNGAGKTSTLSILTGETEATSGEIFIANQPLQQNSHGVSLIGFCPQVDPLLDLMNAYETLWFFGRIRGEQTLLHELVDNDREEGIREDVLYSRVQELIISTGLAPHAMRPCGTYSGGNRRKLSLAVALIGDPKLLLLDEPSSGMDPEARRHMWTTIEHLSKRRTVVLVSHSMEEIEALCTRVGVLVAGKMKCLGGIQHLKSKFAGEYLVELRCSPHEYITGCQELCSTIFGGAAMMVVEEVCAGYMRIKVQPGFDLAQAFQALEEHRQRLHIVDYSISQSSLEQVFLRLAKEYDAHPHDQPPPPRS